MKKFFLDRGLKRLLRSSIRVETKNSSENVPGGSKLGGLPDLPLGFKWPYYSDVDYKGEFGNRPLSFLAQINLKDVTALDFSKLLPEQGLLSFFYETMSMPWGLDFKEKGCARVYYFPDDASSLQRTNFPNDLSSEGRFSESSLVFSQKASLPDFEEYLNLTTPNKKRGRSVYRSLDLYYDLLAEFGVDISDPESKLLGYADPIQGSNLARDCALVSYGINIGGAEYKLTSEQEQDIHQQSKDWILLFQLCSTDEMMFGDLGCVYYFIHRQDLAQRDFSKIWLRLECT